jgi:hypothetical protein
MTLLTEGQAWRVIAEELFTAEHFSSGLCTRIECIYERVSHETRDTMRVRVSHHAKESPHRWRNSPTAGWFAYPMGTEREARVLAALWMAEEADAGVEP